MTSTPQEPGGNPLPADSTGASSTNDAAIDVSSLAADERQYVEEHSLRKPLRTPQIWALGVGAVITGEFFGWNGGLGVAGPIGMLIASLFVCALYMAWVLSLSELSVAMPYAGGPLAYGRRAVGPWFGFVMGWSMFLESLFAMVGTAIATGGYIYFILAEFFPQLPQGETTTIAALATVVLFGFMQWIGAREQAKVMEWMTYGAIVALIWFWIACIPAVDLSRIFTTPLLMHGWSGVIKAIPFAIWWLVIIESVALAAEEAHEPHISIPRGLTLAQLTLIVLVILTWFFASAAGSDYTKTGDPQNLFPLPFVYREVWPEAHHAPHVIAFSVLALCGMAASYNGMTFAVSRQAFSLGRAGYLPSFLGHVHPVRRTPDASIAFWSLVTAGFVIWGFFNETAVVVAVLTCNLTALIWYILAMVCLYILRVKEPHMPRPYRVPWYPFLPAVVIVMSLFSAVIYGWLNESIVLKLTLAMYAIGLTYYFGYARTRLVAAAPEELTARQSTSSEPACEK